MYFIIPPHHGTWLAVQPHLTRYNLEERIKQTQVCISDLDETDCESPAKAIVMHQWPRRLADAPYRTWLTAAVLRKIKAGKRGDSASWSQYVELFLSTPEARAGVQAHITPDFVLKSFYPKVDEFYALVPIKRFYITRNIAEVAKLYAEMYGFADSFSEVYNKAQFINQFVQQHHWFQHYIVRGDSEEDQQMLDELRSLQRSSKIKSVLGIYCADRPLRNGHDFEVETSKDHTALVSILKAR